MPYERKFHSESRELTEAIHASRTIAEPSSPLPPPPFFPIPITGDGAELCHTRASPVIRLL